MVNVIEAELRLVPVSGGAGGTAGPVGSAGQEVMTREMALEQYKANRETNLTMKLIRARLIPLLAFTVGNMFMQAQLDEVEVDTEGLLNAGKELFGGQEEKEQREALENNRQALEELEDAGLSTADNLQTLEDGTIVLRDEFGNVVQTFGDSSNSFALAVDDANDKLASGSERATTTFWNLEGASESAQNALVKLANYIEDEFGDNNDNKSKKSRSSQSSSTTTPRSSGANFMTMDGRSVYVPPPSTLTSPLFQSGTDLMLRRNQYVRGGSSQ